MSLAAQFGFLDSDLSDAVELCSDVFEVERALPSSIVKGIVQKQTRKTFRMSGSIQPMTNKDLKHLPEGQRVDGRIVIYSVDPLHTATTSQCSVPDRITYRSASYVVERVNDWKPLGGFYKAEASRVDP